MSRTGTGLKAWVADVLTLSNGVFGFLSILTWAVELGPLSALPDDVVAAAYIGLGVAADGIDGVVARAWGSTGLGNALDSINDAITFSVAPAVFLVKTYESFDGASFRFALSIVAVGFVLAGILRLARHQTDGGNHEGVFKGLPTPWSAAALVSLLLLSIPGWAALAVAVILGGLNLSKIPYPKTRGAYTKPAVAIVLLALAVIAALLVLGDRYSVVLWVAGVVAVGMVALAPLFAPT